MDEQNTGVNTPRRSGRTPAATSATRAQDMDVRSPASGEDSDEAAERHTDRIRAEIEQTREDMSETVDAIQDRLRPSTIASNAAEGVTRAAAARVQAVAQSPSLMYFRENPMATTMVAIGVAGVALLARSKNNTGATVASYRRGNEIAARSRVANSAATYSGYSDDRYQDEDAGTRWPHGRTQPRGNATMSRRQNRWQRTWNESPLLIGAAAVVAGAIAGLAVPETDIEDDLMGETRDSMIEGVQETAREKINQVQEAASSAASTLKNAVGLSDSGDQEQERTSPG